MTNRKKSYFMWGGIAAVLAIIIGCVYAFYYVPRTPEYSLKLIYTAVQEKNSQEFFKHVDTKSIVENMIDRELDKNNAGPFERGFSPLIKSMAVAAVNNTITEEFKKTDTDTTKKEDTKSSDSEFSKLFKFDKNKKDIKFNGVSSTKKDGNATITVSLTNTVTNKNFDLQLMARQLDDGTWCIYDLPNALELESFLDKTQSK